jgi:hypothetical protein
MRYENLNLEEYNLPKPPSESREIHFVYLKSPVTIENRENLICELYNSGSGKTWIKVPEDVKGLPNKGILLQNALYIINSDKLENLFIHFCNGGIYSTRLSANAKPGIWLAIMHYDKELQIEDYSKPPCVIKKY